MELLSCFLAALVVVAIALSVLALSILQPGGISPFDKDSRKPRQPIERDEEKRRAVLKVGYVAERVPQQLDAVIVGSGLGGLVAGALLAKAGKRVCVFEQHDQAGGCLHTFTEGGFEFDTGIHYVGEMLSKGALRFLLDQVTSGQVAWAPLEPVFDNVALGNPGSASARRIGIAAGREQFAARLLAAFPAEGTAISGFMRLLREARADMAGYVVLKFLPAWLSALVASSGFAGLLFRFFRRSDVTLKSALDALTQNEELKAVLAYSFGDYGTKPSEAPFSVHAVLINHFLQGAAYPVGGSSEVAYALCNTITAAGGAVLVRAPVERIVLDATSSRVTGVVLARDGSVVSAPIVISDAGIFNTFNELLPTEKGRPLAGAAGVAAANYLKHVRHGLGGFQVFVGLEGTAEELGIGASNTWAFASADLEGDLDRYAALEPTPETLAATDVPLIFVSFPSAKDPSWAARFPGRSTCEIVTVAPWEWFAADAGKRSGKRGHEYEARKAAIAGRIWAQVQALYPTLAGRVPMHLSAGSPLTNAFYYRAQGGVMYGADHNTARFEAAAAAALRPGSALGGLYLTGQDVFLCGFGGAMFGGLLCASSVLGRNLYADLLRLKARSPPPDFPCGTVYRPNLKAAGAAK